MKTLRQKLLLTGLSFGLLGQLMGSCQTAAPRPLEITIWLDTNDKEIRYFKAMASKLRESYPRYRLKLRFISFDNMKPRFQGQVGETREPDILYMMNDWVGELVEQNLLRPLTLKNSELTPLSLQSMRYRGKLYGAPFVHQTLALVYNKNHVKTPPATPSEILDLPKHDHKPGAYAMLYDQGNFYYHAPWFHACGGHLFNKGKLDIQPQPLIDSIFWAQKLQRENVVPPGSSYSAMVNLFSAGQADLMITGPWSLSVLDENELTYGVAPIPQSDCAGRSRPFAGVKGFGLNQFSENPEAAENVIRFLVSEAAQQKALKMLDNLPTHKKVLSQDLPPDKQAFKTQLEQSILMPNAPVMKYVWQEMNFLLSQALKPSEGQMMTPAELRTQVNTGLKRLQSEAQKYESL